MRCSYLLRGGAGYRETLTTLGLTPKAVYLVTESWPNPTALMNATEAQLRSSGVTPAQARRISAAATLARLAHEVDPRRYIVDTSDVLDVVGPTMAWAEQELFAVLALDLNDGLIDAATVAMGDDKGVNTSPRMVFRDAVRAKADGVIFVHNHPSGNPTPSEEDISFTHRLVHAGSVLGIRVVDHVVVARGGRATSLAQMGVIGSRRYF